MSIARRGPRRTKASKSTASPRAKPMRPEMPSQPKRQGSAPTGKGEPSTRTCSSTMASSAQARRVMFTVGLPTRWPARLKSTELVDQQKAVSREASSPA